MSEEHRISGVSASNGIAIGTVHIYRRIHLDTDFRSIDAAQSDAHWSRFLHALDQVEEELKRIAALARNESGDEASTIIETHIQMVRDPELLRMVESHIRTSLKPADAAVYDAFSAFLTLMKASGNRLFEERMTDIRDVRDRIVYRLQHDSTGQPSLSGSILLADDLTPTEVVELARQGLKAIALNSGGLTSHASIIARSMSIPTLVACKGWSGLADEGCNAIVDGTEGVLILNPLPATLSAYRTKQQGMIARRSERHSIASLPAITTCGVEVTLRANIEFENELPHMVESGAIGIGLLRTESFFMASDQGTLATQQVFYEHAAEAAAPHPVVIRLFDVGGDKVTDLREKEANPFLGWRGIRILLDRRELLREQLRAILGAAGKYPGQIRIMAPMITLLKEVDDLRAEVARIQNERVSQELPVDPDVAVGIMVEVPAVALQAEEFAKKVDFFSIGTNDLTQYTLAVDRGNPKISELYQHHHPAVYRLIDMTVKAADRHSIPVAVCGELASDPDAAEILIGLGVRDLSMSPSALADVKERIRASTCEQMKLKAVQRIGML